jgi:hypothetical protein
MGYASCLENIVERAQNDRFMYGPAEAKPAPKSAIVVVSPPLQPAFPVFMPPPPQLDAEAIAKRERAAHERHVLALYELMPGKRWRQ